MPDIKIIQLYKILAVIFACLALYSYTPVHAHDNSVQSDSAQSLPPPAAVGLAFSPDGGATDLVIKAIKSARQRIHVAAFSFTSHPIGKALADAKHAGIDVDVVLDHDQMEKGNHSSASWLAAQSIPVRIDTMHALQHNKYMVIDGKTVETGSFNYTAAAEQHNAENVLVLWDAPKLAAAYDSNWKSLWDKAEAYSGQ